MDVEIDSEHIDLLQIELARSESERARAESRCERLENSIAAHLRVESELRAELLKRTTAQEGAEQTLRLAVAELDVLKDMWAHAQTRLDAERLLRFTAQSELDHQRAATHAEHERVRALAGELDAMRADRDHVHAQLMQVTSSRAWTLTAPLRRLAGMIRRVRAHLLG